MTEARICGIITEIDPAAIKSAHRQVDLFELRIDLAGKGWEKIATLLKKPWIATNRSKSCGGKWKGSEQQRLGELLRAAELGADIVDIELEVNTLCEIVPRIRKQAKCLISFHDWRHTPSLSSLSATVHRQLSAGADICKVVTTAIAFSDNITILQLLHKFRDIKLVSFAMGESGRLSRVLSPMVGGYMTYASISNNEISAPGQISLKELAAIYRVVQQ